MFEIILQFISDIGILRKVKFFKCVSEVVSSEIQKQSEGDTSSASNDDRIEWGWLEFGKPPITLVVVSDMSDRKQVKFTKAFLSYTSAKGSFHFKDNVFNLDRIK